ncbi:Serine palmitoyltransferase-regulating protein TSC3 [Nakaseomyces bracarensis]|uniref:Serine palmitoyltransferase-regulating protein TSC3 n=1 Tax=Nakaseomyces bracarensis TaxID=273131 RepID=A0ABR4NMA7_9SACH
MSTHEKKSTMRYVLTTKERRVQEGNGTTLMHYVEDICDKVYWMYYIHMPYYLMTSFDAFCLHTFFLIIFSLSIFGVVKYCFL